MKGGLQNERSERAFKILRGLDSEILMLERKLWQAKPFC